MGNTTLFAIDTDAQSIAGRGLRDEEGATVRVGESVTTRDDSLDTGFDFVPDTGQMDRRGDTLGSTQARWHARGSWLEKDGTPERFVQRPTCRKSVLHPG